MNAKDFLRLIIQIYPNIKAVARDKNGNIAMFLSPPIITDNHWEVGRPEFSYWINDPRKFNPTICPIEWESDDWTKQIVTIGDLD